MAPFRAHQPDGVRSARRHPRFVRSKSLGGPDDPAARAGTSPGVRSPGDQRDHVQRGERRPRGPRAARVAESARARASRGRRRTRPAPLSAPAAGDWIELHNPGDGAVDVTSFTLIGSRSKKDGEKTRSRSSGAAPVLRRLVLAGGGRVCRLAPEARPRRGRGERFLRFQPDRAELLTVLDRSGALVDAVEYDDEDGWRKPPTAAPRSSSSTRGWSLDPFSWSASVVVGGTPGRRNDAR